jgi:isocitrate dehydrogenase
MDKEVAITVAKGDGIGPEIMDACLEVILAAGAKIKIEEIEIGEKVYLRGETSGIEPSSWESLRRTKVFLKAPITTPQGGGYKSLNVTTRKSLGLFANVRPCISYHPYISTKHPIMDVVIIRENEEDLYAGIEHRQTQDVYQCLKLISKPGSEKIVRYAFEYAKLNNRKKVSCFTKDNIMKLTDGVFHAVFEEIGSEYPEIEKEHWIVDIGAAKLADTPEVFDVIVLPNLYGDILSDVAAQIAGSVGLAGSANIGDHGAMFEAIHGSAPRRAGQNLANPTGLLLGSVLMLNHIGQFDVASRVHNAILKTIEDGVHTYDIYDETVSRKKVGTKEYAKAIIERIGDNPKELKKIPIASENKTITVKLRPRKTVVKDLVGVDIFLDDDKLTATEIAEKLNALSFSELKLEMISNRGTKVWPDGMAETFCTDHWRCRFKSKIKSGGIITHSGIVDALTKVISSGLDFIKTEGLYNFGGESGYTGAQGQ